MNHRILHERHFMNRLLFFLISCHLSVLVASEASPQGVHLEVRQLVGNHMPGPGFSGGLPTIRVAPGTTLPPGVTLPPKAGAKPPSPGLPLKETPVLVFQGRVKPITDPAEGRKLDSFVKELKTDAEGKLSIALEPGIYTFVSVIEGKLYRNGYQFDGERYWSSHEIKAGEWSRVSIQDTRNAAF